MSEIFVTLSLAILAGWLTLVTASNVGEQRSYDGYSVIRSLPQTEGQLEHLRELMEESDDHYGDLQFWTEPSALNGSVDVMVKPDYLNEYTDKLSSWEIPYEEMISDVGEKISNIETGMDIPHSSINRLHLEVNETLKMQLAATNYYSRYQRYSVMEAKLMELAMLDERIKVEVIGKSYEDRKLYLVKVSQDHEAKKPVILIDAGHHAREWISHSTLMYLLESIVNIDIPRVSSSRCQTQKCRRPKLDLTKYDYWFIPAVNPDGYEYTHTTDRLWRKTRSPNGYVCGGVDPNRNYPFHWRESGSSTYACSEIYAGSKPLSEPETRAVTTVMDNNKGRILAYLSLHSYSQLIMSPYGYQRVYPHNYDELRRSAYAFIESLSKLRDTKFRFGVTSMILYPAAGASDDYAHGSANIRFTYTIELPDQGNNGFTLPASEIVPVGQETLIGLQALIESM